MWFDGAAAIFNKFLVNYLEMANNKTRKKDIANIYFQEFLDLLLLFRSGEKNVNEFSTNARLIKFFRIYIKNRISEYLRQKYSENLVYDHMDEDEDGEERQGSLNIAAYQYSQKEPEEEPKNKNDVTTFLARPEVKQELENSFWKAPLQEKVYREFLKWIEDDRKYILILTNQYKKTMCEDLGLYYRADKEYFQLLDNEIVHLQKKIIKLCRDYGIDIDSYLRKNYSHGQVNHKKGNYINAKNILQKIRGKPLLACINEILNFYEEYKKLVPEVKYEYRYDSQQYCVYLELLDYIEFKYLPKVNKIVANRIYFVDLPKREQYLILYEMKSALIKYVDLYSRYDNHRIISKAA